MQLSLSSPKDVPQDAYPFFPPFVPSLCDFYVRSEFFLRSPVKQVAAALATYFWHRLRLKLLLESRLRLWTGKSRRSLLGGGEKTANSENSCQTRKNVAKVNFRFIFIEIVFLQCCCSSPKQKKKREFGLKRLIYTEGIVSQTKMNLIFSSAFRLLCGATFFGVQLTG